MEERGDGEGIQEGASAGEDRDRGVAVRQRAVSRAQASSHGITEVTGIC